MTEEKDAFGVLESELQKQISLLRRDIEARVAPLEELVRSYRTALETEAAKKAAASHSLKAPKSHVVSAEAAARALSNYMRTLPELKASEGSEAASAPEANAPSASVEHEKTEEKPVKRTIYDVLPELIAATQAGKIVIIGAFSGRSKELPAPLDGASEWIDTVRDGVHAIGNLPQRIRRGGIAAVVLCEQLISHQHSEPVVQAARGANVPVGFAGKGGSLGLTRALEAIEGQLSG